MEYKSCHLLEHGICFYNNSLCSCCYAPQDGFKNAPYIFPLYNGQKINIEALNEKIRSRREKAKQGIFLESCQNCYQLQTKNWDEELYIDNIYITHFENCNANCIYCITDLKPEERAVNTYKIIPVLEDLKDKKILRENSEFHIGGGEFTIYPECDEIINRYVISGFSKHLAIATNGIKYSESVFKAMDMDKASIIISLDCGSKSLYKKIKRIDAFETLKENLKLYTRTNLSRQNTFLKYIVLPKVNDNKKEFQNFLNIAEQYNIKGIKIDIDGHYSRYKQYKPDKNISDYTNSIINIAKEQGFEVEIFQFYKQCLST